jgi:hypothetical protein
MSDLLAHEAPLPPLTGLLIPWRFDGAQLFHMPNCPDYFMPLFSSEKALREFMAKVGLPCKRICEVTNGDTFLENLPLLHGAFRLRIIVNPTLLDNGNMHFTEVPRTDPEIA